MRFGSSRLTPATGMMSRRPAPLAAPPLVTSSAVTATMSKATWMKAWACRLGQRRLQEADADDAGREPGDQHVEIECRRRGAERLRPGREQGERDQHRGNREPVEVEESQHAPGELGIASRSLDFRRPLHRRHFTTRPSADPRRGPRLRRGSSHPLQCRDESSRIPVEARLRRLRRARAAGPGGVDSGGGGRRGPRTAGTGVGGQGAGPRGRARQGRRREALPFGGGSRQGRARRCSASAS